MAASKRRKPKVPARKDDPKSADIDLQELLSIVEQAKASLSDKQHAMLRAAVDTLGFVTAALESKDISIERLRRILFGPTTEATSALFPKGSASGDQDPIALDEAVADRAQASDLESPKTEPKKKQKSHGRNAAAAYTGAERRSIAHEELKAGDPCPACPSGKVYPMQKPKTLVRITGMSPLQATVIELERLRCNLCNRIFAAREPPGLGAKKYDETAASMVALLKYGVGMPFNRIETLQKDMGIPMPASTQWELVAQASEKLLPVYQELVRHAAQGEVIHNDDTTMKILELTGVRRQKAIASGDIDPDQRVGLFTSGILSNNAGIEIALFFTGTKHAGENLAKVLSQRMGDLAPPIQMCDALSRNMTGDFDAILSHCLVHARRQFVDVAENFPRDCRFVLEQLARVYRKEDEIKKEGLSPADRLRAHQDVSGPIMAALEDWLDQQVEKKLVEPNSSLGAAIAYMRKHWEKLTLFLREPAAPLDNNVCERVLKKAVLHRKNAYFYKTQKGARVGDLYMSLIHTAELCKSSPFDYLVAVLRNAKDAARSPEEWMPWNFAQALTDAAGAPQDHD